jgi:hypothetical protein
MPRRCGPCGDKKVNILDRRLLNMAASNESYRTISNEFGYTESALKRHRSNHLVIDLGEVHAAMVNARESALQEAHERELKVIKAEVMESTASRLENCTDFLGQLREVRRRAAALLDQAEEAQDLRAAGTFIKELREQIRLWAELEGKLASQPQVNILINPEWVQLRTTIITALEPYPEAKEAVINAIHT